MFVELIRDLHSSGELRTDLLCQGGSEHGCVNHIARVFILILSLPAVSGSPSLNFSIGKIQISIVASWCGVLLACKALRTLQRLDKW